MGEGGGLGNQPDCVPLFGSGDYIVLGSREYRPVIFLPSYGCKTSVMDRISMRILVNNKKALTNAQKEFAHLLMVVLSMTEVLSLDSNKNNRPLQTRNS